MNTIKTYEVTYVRNGEYLKDIIETLLTIEEIKTWFIRQKNAFMVLGIHEYTDIPKDIRDIIRI